MATDHHINYCLVVLRSLSVRPHTDRQTHICSNRS